MLSRLARFSLLLALCFSLIPQPAAAQGGVSEARVEYIFGEQVRFSAQANTQVPIQEAVILFDAEGVAHVRPAAVEVSSDGQLHYVYPISGERTLRPFSKVSYRYRVTLTNGDVFTTPFYSFDYLDNRFAWQTLEAQPFSVHWYEGDIAFGQNILDVARAGLDKGLSLLPSGSLDAGLDIYVYRNAQDMQAALVSSSESWIAGHADPDLDVVLVSIAAGPDQNLIIEQRVPHELMHVMLYHSARPGYGNLPAWLTEGLASTAELYPNPDYQVLISNAYDQNRLLPMNSLCQTFPRDASGTLLAYAEAVSFTRYLFRTYGASGIEKLVGNYADGLSCERGFEASFGRPLIQAERQWRQDTFGENAGLAAFTNFLPWLALLAAVLVIPLLAGLLQLRQARRGVA